MIQDSSSEKFSYFFHKFLNTPEQGCTFDSGYFDSNSSRSIISKFKLLYVVSISRNLPEDFFSKWHIFQS